MKEQNYNGGKIVLALEKFSLKAEERKFVPFEIPLSGKLSEIPDKIKELYFDEKSLQRIGPQCGYKQVYWGNFLRADSEERYPAPHFNYPLKNVEAEGELIRTSLVMIWIAERQEWVTMISERHLGKEIKNIYSGPYSLDDYCAEGIRESYRIKPNTLSSGELITTSHDELEKLNGGYEHGCI